MISFIRGRVAEVSPAEVVVDVSGIGLLLHCTPSTTSTVRVGDETRLAASLVVREDSLTLFGFTDDDERTVFELLQTASGVGPRLAQAMLAVYRPDELRRAVAAEDLAALTKVPGIGRKGAQRIVIELKDRLGVPASGPADQPSAEVAQIGSDGWRDQVHSALLGLGWSARDAEAAAERVAPMVGDGISAGDVPAILKAALRTLAKQ